MADQSDVENALVTLAAAALYPTGPAAPSVPGPDCLIYPGWPNSAALNDDLAAGRVNVTVFPMPEIGKNTTRYRQQWVGPPTQPTLTTMVTDNEVTIGGTASPGQVVGILVGDTSFAYRVQTGDTPELVAACLAMSLQANWIVNVSGATIGIMGARCIRARVVADVTVMQELRRQEQGFRITCWCPTPITRDAAASAIDVSLAGNSFISLADGSQGRLRYRGSLVFDQSQDALLYRRDIIYDVEYPTIVTDLQPAMLVGRLIFNAGSFVC